MVRLERQQQSKSGYAKLSQQIQKYRQLIEEKQAEVGVVHTSEIPNSESKILAIICMCQEIQKYEQLIGGRSQGYGFSGERQNYNELKGFRASAPSLACTSRRTHCEKGSRQCCVPGVCMLESRLIASFASFLCVLGIPWHKCPAGLKLPAASLAS
jgi:hypothetical protein